MMLARIFICMQQLKARNCKRYSFALKNCIQEFNQEEKMDKYAFIYYRIAY